jgi:hypothetical protein
LIGFFVGWTLNAYFKQKEKVETLASQIKLACEQNDFGPGFSPEDQEALCENADKIVEDEGEIQQDEIQEREIQEREIQEREIQNRENQDEERQDREKQDQEVQDGELNDRDPDDPETDDPDPDDPDPDDPEIQDEETDDPDPASPYNFTFTFTIPGDNPAEPDRTYTVTCNSGTGECTVS